MKVLIVGGTGFIGRHLTKAFNERGYHVYVSTRSPNHYETTKNTTFINERLNPRLLPPINIIINLAGESLFGYWTAGKKERILTSRIQSTKEIIHFMEDMKQRPEVFINASAIGFYGVSDDVIFTESTKQSGADFLATVVKKWEETAKQTEKLDIRTIYARFGLVLGESGSLPLMSLPVKLGLGGKIGSGKQYMSWVHIDDVVDMLLHAIEHNLSGPINITAPNPEQNKQFIKKLAKVLKRPSFFPTPKILLRTGLGDMSNLITEGQYVLPKKLQDANYQFNYPTLEKSLENIFN